MRTMYYAKIKDTQAITNYSEEFACFLSEPLMGSKTLFLFSEAEKENRDVIDCGIDDGEETLADLIADGALEWVAVQIPV